MPTTTRSTMTWPSSASLEPAARARRPLRDVAAARELERDEIFLADNVAHSVRRPRGGVEVTVLEGMVMVTRERDGEDHVVRAGETFRSDRGGHHVVLSLRPSRVRIAERP